MTAARQGARGLASPLSRIKDAGLASLVVLVLATPLVGFETYDDGGTLALRTRWAWVGVAGGLMFFGRLIFRLIYDLATKRKTEKTAPALAARRQQGQRMALIARALFWGALGLAAILPFLPFTSRYAVDIATTVLIYVMLGWGLNVVVGLAGLLDLGYVGFYAIGAYSYALLSIHFGLNFWQALPFAGLFAAIAGVLLGFPVLRLRGDYLAIVTLGFGEMIRIILTNWTELTGGPNGLTSLPRPSFFGLPFTRAPPAGGQSFSSFFGLDFASEHRVIFLYFIILALALATNGLVMRLRALPIGRSWEALREDEIACRSLGINPTNVKLSAFGLGAMLGGLAGAFFATRQGFISPESFSFTESAVVLAIVVLGGMGSQIGVVIAALFLVLLPELGREFAQYRMLVFGMAMIAVMVWKPSGLLSRRVPTVTMPVAPPVRREGAA